MILLRNACLCRQLQPLRQWQARTISQFVQKERWFSTDTSPAQVLAKKLDFYSSYKPSALSIQQFVDFAETGDETLSFRFLRKELLVRLANIMCEFNMMPLELLNASSTAMVKEWYEQSFAEVVLFEDATINRQNMEKFTEELTSIYNRHKDVVQRMAEGLMEYKERHQVDASTEKRLQYFVDRFYISRISIRMLISQHILLFGSEPPTTPSRHIGSVDPECPVEDIIRDAYESARFLCENYYMVAPDLKVEHFNAVDKNEPITIVYVPSHLFHIMFELFKNAMRATVEHNEEDDLPAIKVFVVRGKEDLSIKICDRGGGVCRSVVDMLFNYLYTTAPVPHAQSSQPPLAGLGYGLPISRLYARYFQGDLGLVSMDGYGTDACLYLKAMSSDAFELLPVYGSSSRMQYQRKRLGGDWSSPNGYRYHR